MPIGNTTSVVVDPVVRDFYDGMALARALPLLLHGKFGQVRPIDQKSGDRAKFRRYESVAVNQTPLIEMTTPSPVQVTKTDITATLDQYGAYMKYSDKVSYTTQDPALAEFSALMGENEGQTLDLVFRDKLLATTSIYYAGAPAITTRVGVTARALGTDFDKIARLFHNANAKPYDPNIIGASTGIGTVPQRACFYVIVHPDVQYDVDNTTNFPGFIPVAAYPDPTRAIPGEFGAYKEFRFVSTTYTSIILGAGAAVAATGLKSTGGYIDIYQCLIFAQNAYGVVPLNGRSHEVLVTELGADKADPLGQFGTIGWKSMQTLALLNETFMTRYECGAIA
jgi:N4-gp56 family major capsid protein